MWDTVLRLHICRATGEHVNDVVTAQRQRLSGLLLVTTASSYATRTQKVHDHLTAQTLAMHYFAMQRRRVT